MGHSPASSELRELLEAAVLAPSSHNTQPWLFRLSDSRISLLADRTRALPVNDPDDRELAISCGAALLNLRVAAARAGYASKTRLLPDAADHDLLAVVELNKESQVESQDAELYPAVAKRRTYRKRFEPKPVPEPILTELGDAAEREGAWLKVLSDDRMRRQVSELVAEGDAVQWSNPSWRRELAAWMHPRRQGDGLTVPGLVAPLAKSVVRTFDMGDGVGAKDSQLADESPILAVLGTSGDGPKDWLSSGQALQRLLLVACLNGLQASYLNQPVQVPSLRPKLQHAVDAAGFPQILLRLGFPSKELHPAPRRVLDDVIEI